MAVRGTKMETPFYLNTGLQGWMVLRKPIPIREC